MCSIGIELNYEPNPLPLLEYEEVQRERLGSQLAQFLWSTQNQFRVQSQLWAQVPDTVASQGIPARLTGYNIPPAILAPRSPGLEPLVWGLAPETKKDKQRPQAQFSDSG